MDNIILRTSADDLYELVKSRKKISVEEAAKILKIPDKVVQALVDFLVEEEIFGIEYKFTTPYVYISQEKEKKISLESKPKKELLKKEEFFQKAGTWNISSEKINDLILSISESSFTPIHKLFKSKFNFPVYIES